MIKNELVSIENGQVLTTSREIAEHFNKAHKDVLESIRNLTAENSAVKNMFIYSEYKNSRGRTYTEYLINRDGFSLLAMGFTGKDNKPSTSYCPILLFFSFLCIFRFHYYFSKLGFGPASWDVVQLVERLTVNQYIVGSNPTIPVFPIYDIVFHRRHGVDFAHR